jgi:hypothetical protein
MIFETDAVRRFNPKHYTLNSFPGVMIAWNKGKGEGWLREINCTGAEAEVGGFNERMVYW